MTIHKGFESHKRETLVSAQPPSVRCSECNDTQPWCCILFPPVSCIASCRMREPHHRKSAVGTFLPRCIQSDENCRTHAAHIARSTATVKVKLFCGLKKMVRTVIIPQLASNIRSCSSPDDHPCCSLVSQSTNPWSITPVSAEVGCLLAYTIIIGGL